MKRTAISSFQSYIQHWPTRARWMCTECRVLFMQARLSAHLHCVCESSISPPCKLYIPSVSERTIHFFIHSFILPPCLPGSTRLSNPIVRARSRTRLSWELLRMGPKQRPSTLLSQTPSCAATWADGGPLWSRSVVVAMPITTACWRGLSRKCYCKDSFGGTTQLYCWIDSRWCLGCFPCFS